MQDVDVIIASYGTRDLTAAAVRSALEAAETQRVVVVDNASPDGSAEHLATAFAAAPVEVVRLADNRGFGAACNVGAERALAPYLFFLNSDAAIETGCLGVLRERLRRDRAIGVAAPAVHEAPGGPLQVDAQGRFPSARSILLRATRRHTDTLEPDWVSGVAFLVRRQEFLALGGFDPEFFMYYEDVDLCRRYRAAGQSVVRDLRARVVHHGGASRSSSAAQKATYDRSQDHYLRRIGTPIWGRWIVRGARRLRRTPRWGAP